MGGLTNRHSSVRIFWEVTRIYTDSSGNLLFTHTLVKSHFFMRIVGIVYILVDRNYCSSSIYTYIYIHIYIL